MTRRLIVLDLALVSLLVAGIVKFRGDWLAFEPAHQVSAIQPKPETLPALPAAKAAAPVGAADWTEIPTRNPFSFDRNDIAILAPPPEPPKAVGPKPVLFGTMNLGQNWIAMLASGQPNNRNSRPVRVGEIIDGWTVVEIKDKAVVVEANSSRQTVDIDAAVLVPRDSGRTPAAAAPPPPSISVGQTTPPASSGASAPAPANNSNPGTPCVRELKTPFGTVKQPCEDRAR